jgi:hypothetical protein
MKTADSRACLFQRSACRACDLWHDHPSLALNLGLARTLARDGSLDRERPAL